MESERELTIHFHYNKQDQLHRPNTWFCFVIILEGMTNQNIKIIVMVSFDIILCYT